MADVLKKFGRYFLLDHLAQGGMAEIYRARLAGRDGAGRLMVIKRIQANFGGNTEFLQMFKTETKVTMGFNHPNIVQLYDFGEEANQPYIVMEWVDGRNLRQMMSRFAEMKQSFPVELAAYVIEQAAGGLHYAHGFRDKISGQPLNIVHRDISPQNILVSFEGTVKIIDFGIAKAASQGENTRAGVIKGKPSYLSPEQISGEALDGRCDLFALGAVLWELLTGKKLFAGENDLAVLKMIESAQTHVKPPSKLNPKVPKELDYIVLRALAKSREKRFQTGEEMSRALHKFLYSYMPEFNPQDLGYYAKDLFKEDIVEDRKKIQRLNDKVEQLLAQDIPDLTRGQTAPVPNIQKNEDTTTLVQSQGVQDTRRTGAREFDQPLGNDARPPQLEMEARPSGPSSRPATALNASRTIQAPRSSGATPQTRAPAAAAANASVRTPAPAVKSSRTGLLALVAALVGIVIAAPELGVRIPLVSDWTERWTGIGGRREVASTGSTNGGSPKVEQIAAPLGRRKIMLKLFIGPGCGGKVQLAGQLLTPERIPLRTPQGVLVEEVEGYLAEVPLDEPLELKIERKNFLPVEKEFQLASNDYGHLKEVERIESMTPILGGRLTMTSTPNSDRVVFIRTDDNCSWPGRVPMVDELFPPGDYRVKLLSTVLDMRAEVLLSIEKDRKTDKGGVQLRLPEDSEYRR